MTILSGSDPDFVAGSYWALINIFISSAESSSGTQHVKSDDLPHLIVYLEMKKEKRTNKTWATLKSALCQSADKFVAAEKLIVEPCRLIAIFVAYF